MESAGIDQSRIDEDCARTSCLVHGFGDAGHRLYQAFAGKFCSPLPDGLAIHRLILSGRSGIGKSLLLLKLAEHFRSGIVRINIGKLVATGNQHFALKQRLESVPKNKRVVVWLVDIELFRGLYGGVVESFIKSVRQMPKCILVMTTRHPDKIVESIRFVCDDHIRLLVPNKDERTHLCRWFAGDRLPIEGIVETTHGMGAAEIFSVLLAEMKIKLGSNSDTRTINSAAALESKVTWNDIGGLDGVINELHECIVWPVTYRDKFVELGIKPPRGILLYGPPGTGKTMLAKAIATEVSANFISVAIPDLIKGEFGESEKALAATFENAKRSPSILFLDEIEAIFGTRENSGEVGKKLISQLFLEMDNIPEDSRLVILAATNAPDLIDASIQRSGRLDKKIYIPLPSESARLDILRRMVRHLSIEDDSDILCDLAKHELSGAEIKLLVRGACYVAIRNNRETLVRSDFETALQENKRVSTSSSIFDSVN